MRTMATLAVFLFGSLGSAAEAQTSYEGEGDFGSASYESGLDPAWGVAPSSNSSTQRRMFGGFDLGVPVIVDVDRDLVRPGVNLHGQGGLDLGYVAFFVHGGWRWIPIDYDRAAKAGQTQYAGGGREPLSNPYFGLGVRGQIPNRSRLLPYASASFDFNFWNLDETDIQCTGYYYWWCSEYDVYRFSPGFSGRVGTAIEIRDSFYLDLGMGVSMTFEGNFFESNQAWLEPFIGVMQRL